MERETRSDRMFEELSEFLNSESQTIRSMVLYKSEIDKLKRHLYEQDIPVEISSQKSLKKGKEYITLKKL